MIARILLALLLAGAAEAAVTVSPTSADIRPGRRTIVSYDSTGEIKLDNGCGTVGVSHYGGSGGTQGVAEVWAMQDGSGAVNTGVLIGSFAGALAAGQTFVVPHPVIGVRVATAPSAGIAKVFLWCSDTLGGGGGGAFSVIWPPTQTLTLHELLSLSFIKQAVNNVLSLTKNYGPLSGASYYPATRATVAGATCNAANIGTIYAVTDSNGSCVSGAPNLTEPCECQATDVGYQLKPYRGDLNIWQQFTSGLGGATDMYAFEGIADWVGRWFYVQTGSAASCQQSQWLGNGKNGAGSPYLPVSGHSVSTLFRVAFAQAGTTTAVEETLAFFGYVESNNTDVLIDTTATTAATIIQGISNGYGILWVGSRGGADDNKFFTVWVRAGVENIDLVIDLSNAAARTAFFVSNRGILHALMQVNYLQPLASDASPKAFSYANGFYPVNVGGVGTKWTTVYGGSAAETNGTPSGAALSSSYQVPVAIACMETGGSEAANADLFVGVHSQIITEHGL